MTQLSPALDAALRQDRVTIFGALKIDYPTGARCLLDGSGEIMIGGELYRGEIEGWGSWGGLDELSDGAGDEAPQMALTLLPASAEAAAAMSDPSVQGVAITVMVGVRNDATGLVVGDPYPVFIGEIDMPRHRFGRGTSSVEYECVGGMERLFFNDEGIRLSDTFHRQVWPGEDGLMFVTGLRRKIYWGMKPPAGAVNPLQSLMNKLRN